MFTFVSLYLFQLINNAKRLSERFIGRRIVSPLKGYMDVPLGRTPSEPDKDVWRE